MLSSLHLTRTISERPDPMQAPESWKDQYTFQGISYTTWLAARKNISSPARGRVAAHYAGLGRDDLQTWNRLVSGHPRQKKIDVRI